MKFIMLENNKLKFEIRGGGGAIPAKLAILYNKMFCTKLSYHWYPKVIYHSYPHITKDMLIEKIFGTRTLAFELCNLPGNIFNLRR